MIHLITPERVRGDMAMEYTNWRQAGGRALARRDFRRFDDFIQFVRLYQHKEFHQQSNRLCLKNTYDLRRRPPPFSQTVRFPVDDDYIDVDNEAIRSNMDRILSACDLPDRVNESSPFVLDAKRSFDDAFVNLGKIIFDSDEEDLLEHGVYCRESFETHYGLIWGPKAVEKNDEATDAQAQTGPVCA